MVENEPETTCRMQRDELLGLLEITSPAGHQRVTSEIPTVTLNDLLQHEPMAPPATGTRIERRLAVVAVSFAVTLVAGISMFLSILS